MAYPLRIHDPFHTQWLEQIDLPAPSSLWANNCVMRLFTNGQIFTGANINHVINKCKHVSLPIVIEFSPFRGWESNTSSLNLTEQSILCHRWVRFWISHFSLFLRNFFVFDTLFFCHSRFEHKNVLVFKWLRLFSLDHVSVSEK